MSELAVAVARALAGNTKGEVTVRGEGTEHVVDALHVRVSANGTVEADAGELLTSPSLAAIELDVFVASGGDGARYLGSNIAAVLGLERDAIVVRGRGAVHADDERELLVAIAPQRVRIFWPDAREPVVECALTSVVAVARGDERIGLVIRAEGHAEGHVVVTWQASRALDVPRGRWQATTGTAERIVAMLERVGIRALPDGVGAVDDTSMPSVSALLARVDRFPWRTAERLFELQRLDAIDVLARTWPTPVHAEARQALEYARLYFRIRAGDPAPAVATLRAANPDEWPRLYQEDQPGHAPNLFAMTGQHDRAAFAYARLLHSPPPSRSPVWFRRVAMTLARALHEGGDAPAASDALALAMLYEFGSVEGWVDLARFHLWRNAPARAATWLGLALLHADRARPRPSTLAELADAQTTPKHVREALAASELASLETVPEVADPTRVLALHRDVLRVAAWRSNHQQLDGAKLRRRWTELAALAARWPVIEWTWASGPLALRAFELGTPADDVLDGLARDEGVAPPVALACADFLAQAGRSSEAEAWRDRALRVTSPPWIP